MKKQKNCVKKLMTGRFRPTLREDKCYITVLCIPPLSGELHGGRVAGRARFVGGGKWGKAGHDL